MLLNHSADFGGLHPTLSRFRISLTPGTVVETNFGWVAVEDLEMGMRISTLDGGFALLTGLSYQKVTEPMWHIPAGSLNNWSALILTGDQFVGLADPGGCILFQAPFAMAAVSALGGYKGIRPLGLCPGVDIWHLGFDHEDVIYAETGTLLHAADELCATVYQRFTYAQTRAALTLMSQRLGGTGRRL